jgi:transcriptional regulator with XRE-family HTH domain
MRRRKTNPEHRDLKEVGRRIRWIRRARGFNSAMLGKAAGVTGPQICKIERGEHCRLATLLKVARVLKVSPVVFLVDDKMAEVMLKRLPRGAFDGLNARLEATVLQAAGRIRYLPRVRRRR